MCMNDISGEGRGVYKLLNNSVRAGNFFFSGGLMSLNHENHIEFGETIEK
jgi:hypothetical protein